MKKSCFILCIVAALIFTSCSSKINIPSQNKLISTMEDAGYTVNKTSVIGDIADLSRIVATKGDSILDVCYQVNDKDTDTIIEFYGDTYTKSYITGHINDFVYYASDETVWDISKLDTDISN